MTQYSIAEKQIWISDDSEFEPGITGGEQEINECLYATKEEAKKAIHTLKTTIVPKDNGFLVTEYWMWEVMYDDDGNEVDASTLDLSDI